MYVIQRSKMNILEKSNSSSLQKVLTASTEDKSEW